MSTPQIPLKIAPSRWPRGSEWRRWDLHVHTPESRLGSPFEGLTWEQYVTALEKAAIEARISVIGVTDYMTLEGYEKLFAEKNANGRLGCIFQRNPTTHSDPNWTTCSGANWTSYSGVIWTTGSDSKWSTFYRL